MPVSKVIFGTSTLIDLTADTVTPETLAIGATAHKADGTKITGTMPRGETNETLYWGEDEPAAPNEGDLWFKPEGILDVCILS